MRIVQDFFPIHSINVILKEFFQIFLIIKLVQLYKTKSNYMFNNEIVYLLKTPAITYSVSKQLVLRIETRGEHIH